MSASTSGGSVFLIMDHVIGNGSEDILFKLLRNPDLLKSLKKYFAEERCIVRSMKQVFNKRSSTDFCFDLILKTSGTQLEVLILNNLFEACKEIHSLGIKFRRTENFKLVLQIAVTKTKPNLEMVKFLVENIVPENYYINFNDLLYDIIDNVGEGCEEVANYLVECGATPGVTYRNGCTLLHVAVQWRSAKFLRYIIEELEVPPIDSINALGSSVFALALDANPSPLHTVPGWWEMMLYLTEHVERFLLPTIIAQLKLDSFRLSKQDVQSPWFCFMMCGSDEISEENSWHYNAIEKNFNVRVFMFFAKTTKDPSFDRFAELMKTVPPRKWGLHPFILSLRWNYIFAELNRYTLKVSPTEVLIHYRGSSLMEEDEEKCFKKTIDIMLEREHNASEGTKKRIIQAFAENVCIRRDEEDFEWFTKKDIVQELEEDSRNKMSSIFYEYLNSRIKEEPNGRELLLLERMLLNYIDTPDILRILKYEVEDDLDEF